MTAPKPKVLRVRWRGDDPKPGDWLASGAARWHYRIEAVEHLHSMPLSARPRLKLTVTPFPATKFAELRKCAPAGSASYPWSRTGAPAPEEAQRERIRIRTEQAAQQRRARDRIDVPRSFVEPVLKERGAVEEASWSDDTETDVAGYRRSDPLRKMARRGGSEITQQHIAAADMVRRAYDVGMMGYSPGGSGPNLVYAKTQPLPMLGPPRSAVAQTDAIRDYRRALRCVGAAREALFLWVVVQNRDIASWCEAQTEQHGRRVDPKREMGKLVTILDDLAAHYATELLELENRGQGVV